VIRNVHVQLIFFGSAWGVSTTTPSATQVANAVQNILSGPYMSYLAQYGVGRGTLRGTTLSGELWQIEISMDTFVLSGLRSQA